jgi:hypothetical protein
MILSLQDQNMTAAAPRRFGFTCLTSRSREGRGSEVLSNEWHQYPAISFVNFGGRQGGKPVGSRMLAKTANLFRGLDPSAREEGDP